MINKQSNNQGNHRTSLIISAMKLFLAGRILERELSKKKWATRSHSTGRQGEYSINVPRQQGLPVSCHF